jgi:hypothetical protein
MNDLIDISKEQQRQKLIKAMPKQYSAWWKLHQLPPSIFREECLVEIKIGKEVCTGKCFINKEKRGMHWRPAHQWYIFINEADDCYSYDLLRDRECRIMPTEVQLNTFFEKKFREICKRGKYHQEETKRAYVELQELGVV